MAITEKNPDLFLETTILKDNDLLVLEEDSLIKYTSFSNVKINLQNLSETGDGPQTYIGSNLVGEGSCNTRNGVYETVLSIFISALGNTGIDNKLKLALQQDADGFFQEGLWYIVDLIAYVTFDDTTTMTFEKNDLTIFEGRIISPWGLVPGTENFTSNI